MTGRHAYCIIAHNEPYILRTLVSLIDDPRNDIFLLVDRNSDIRQFSDLRVSRSGFFLAPRVCIHWGAMSQVRAELAILKTAHAHGPYGYYHLISGVDLPLHCQEWIHSYCDRCIGDEFIGFLPVGAYELNCVRYHHFFLEYMRTKNPVERKFFSAIRHSVIGLERKFGYKRRIPFPVRKGANWFSLTEATVSYLLKQEVMIWKHLNHIHTADEIVFHTIFSASPYKDRVHAPGKNGHSNMRLIDWKRGTPYVWRMGDFDELTKSERFFARKFSSVDLDIVNAIAEHVRGE